MLRLGVFFTACMLFIVSFMAPAMANLRDLPQITLLASSNLATPIAKISRLYSRQNNITVTTSYDATAAQAEKIKSGKSADIFISAHPSWMNDVKQLGLIDVYSLTNLVDNNVVLAMSKNHHLYDPKLEKYTLSRQLNYLANRMLLVASDHRDSALGLYTKEALEQAPFSDSISQWQLIESKLIRSTSARNSLKLIGEGMSAGFLFHSDAISDPSIKILATLEEPPLSSIIFQAAVVAGENMTSARHFLNFLKSDQAKDIFNEHGFSVN